MKRQSSQYPKRSNRQRMRDADTAVRLQQRDRMVLLAVLAQKGGDVVITDGTVAQLTTEMSYEILPGATEGERIVRLLMGTVEGDVLPAPGGVEA